MHTNNVISKLKLRTSDDSVHGHAANARAFQIPTLNEYVNGPSRPMDNSSNSRFETSEMPHHRPEVIAEDDAQAVTPDAFRSPKALKDTIYRVSLIALAYTISTSALTGLGGFYFHLYGLGPIEMAMLNALSVVFFVVVMLPFSLLSAWCLRYKQEFPVQQRSFELTVPAADAFELTMAAMETLPGSRLCTVDTTYGIIKYIGASNRKCGSQEITAKIESLCSGKTLIRITSHPKIGAIHFLLFGYTLAVDGSQNKRNVDEIATRLLGYCSFKDEQSR